MAIAEKNMDHKYYKNVVWFHIIIWWSYYFCAKTSFCLLYILCGNGAVQGHDCLRTTETICFNCRCSLPERVWNLYHNWRHGWSWNQRKCLDCTWGEEGPIKRICNGELLKEEEVLAVGIWVQDYLNELQLVCMKKLKEMCFLSPYFSLFHLLW